MLRRAVLVAALGAATGARANTGFYFNESIDARVGHVSVGFAVGSAF